MLLGVVLGAPGYQPGIDHHNFDFSAMPLLFDKDDYSQCEQACKKATGCVGWSYKPIHEVDGTNKTCSTHKAGTKPACWLKSQIGPLLHTPCRIFGIMPTSPPTPAPPIRPCTVEIDTQQVTHTVRREFMGCHSDSGFAHEPRALFSQMVMGESFETTVLDGVPFTNSTWPNQMITPGTKATLGLDVTHPWHGLQSQRIAVHSLPSSGGSASVANRGMANEGMVFEAGKPYEGFVFARSSTAGGVKLVVTIEDHTRGAVLATQEVIVPAGQSWVKLDFNLTPSGSTNCEGISNEQAVSKYQVGCPVNNTYKPGAPMSDRSAHVCVRCAGQLKLALHEVGDVNLDFVFLQPGEWARLAPAGGGKALMVLKSSVEWMQRMGVSLYRLGGTYTKTTDYSWKKWRGRIWERNSTGVGWKHSLYSGWGMFDAMDMAQVRTGIERRESERV
jgi:hypothetical protein